MTYSSEVLADSPTAYWPCDDSAAGSTVTDSVGGLALSASGTPTLGDPSPIGLGLNTQLATGYYAGAGSSALRWLMDTDISVEFLAKRETGVAANYGIVCNRSTATTNLQFAVFLASGSFTLAFDVTGSNFRWSTAYTWSDNLWHHCVFTHTGSTGVRQLYIDGGLRQTSSAVKPTTAFATPGTMALGTLPGSTSFPGHIAGVAVYNGKVLSADRVQAHFQQLNLNSAAMMAFG